MIINRIGAKLHYKGITYTIGDSVIATSESEYEGLFGTITEIRDGDDRETDNDTPDIYCTFLPPFDPDEIKSSENRFSCLYRQEKKLEDIALDVVIMAPEMVKVMTPVPDTRKFTVYEIREEWIYDHIPGVSIEYALDEAQARRCLTEMIYKEKQNGIVPEWINNPNFSTEITPLFYEAWLEGEFCSNHYRASIVHHELCMSQELFKAIGKAYLDTILRGHFAEQIEDWEELEDMTEEQIAQMIAAPKVPIRIRKQLEQNRNLIESYWESVSEASFALVKKFKEGQL